MTQPHRPVGPGDHVFLVDGSSFVFRAYFQSIRQDQKYNYRSDRLPVGAVRLFATKLLQFSRDGAAGIKPTHLAIIFDKSENSFRRELYPPYKAHRPDPPTDLVPQFPLMRATVSAFGLIPIEQDRYEADDLIATYAPQARARGADVLIISADKDLMQLVGPAWRCSTPPPARRRAREERRIGPAEVVDYFGAGPDKVVDVQALAGDSTDNVPGAPGIGVKTAAQLIGEYGDLDTLLARAGEIKQPKRRETLTNPEAVKLIRLSKTARHAGARRRRSSTPLDALGRPKLDGQGADRLPEGDGVHHHHQARRRDLAGLDARRDRARPAIRRPRRLAQAATAKRPHRRRRTRRRPPRPRRSRRAPPAPTRDAADARRAARAREARAIRSTSPLTRPSATPTTLEAWIDRAHEAGVVAFDTETTSLDPMQAELVGVSLAVAPGEACYIPLGHRAGADDLFERRRPAARPIGRGGRDRAAETAARSAGRAQDRPERQIRLARLRPARRRGRAVRRHDADLLRARSRRDQRRPRHGRAVANAGSATRRSRLPKSPARAAISSASPASPIDKATEYAAEDADVTLRLWRALKPRLAAERMATVYETLERPMIPPLARMERARRRRSTATCSRASSGEFAQGMARLEAEIAEAGRGAVQSRLAEAARRHPVRPDGPARRQEDRDRRLVDLGERARRPRRRGPRAAGAHSRLAPARPS